MRTRLVFKSGESVVIDIDPAEVRTALNAIPSLGEEGFELVWVAKDDDTLWEGSPLDIDRIEAVE